jgi:hypothetical protein
MPASKVSLTRPWAFWEYVTLAAVYAAGGIALLLCTNRAFEIGIYNPSSSGVPAEHLLNEHHESVLIHEFTGVGIGRVSSALIILAGWCLWARVTHSGPCSGTKWMVTVVAWELPVVPASVLWSAITAHHVFPFSYCTPSLPGALLFFHALGSPFMLILCLAVLGSRRVPEAD